MWKSVLRSTPAPPDPYITQGAHKVTQLHYHFVEDNAWLGDHKLKMLPSQRQYISFLTICPLMAHCAIAVYPSTKENGAHLSLEEDRLILFRDFNNTRLH